MNWCQCHAKTARMITASRRSPPRSRRWRRADRPRTACASVAARSPAAGGGPVERRRDTRRELVQVWPPARFMCRAGSGASPGDRTCQRRATCSRVRRRLAGGSRRRCQDPFSHLQSLLSGAPGRGAQPIWQQALPARCVESRPGPGLALCPLQRSAIWCARSSHYGHLPARRAGVATASPGDAGRARRGWPPERRRRYGSVRPACRPYGTAGCLVITGGVRFSRERPPRRCRAGALLAGRAHQLGPSVLTPARSDRSGPVVRLPERGRIGEPRPAPGHVAPGGRGPDLVANDAMLSDRNRPSQRIEARNRLQVFAVTVRPEAERPEPGYPASLAGHARSPGVPGKLPELTGPPSLGATVRRIPAGGAPAAGSRPGCPGNGPRIFSLRSAQPPRFVTPHMSHWPAWADRGLAWPPRGIRSHAR